ncbi:hypothetical protein HO133_003237 [Letharia lupina]|uniref:ATP synthase F(0) complex subunit e, mitochondrial n=1 Tax=Letharia lupina TaxID=560253 RepID=A0A8H6CBE3_9LECA|nr:uncharacterized protein HO133_003237 [Letharia lupina]KAF6220106.1 hypothetical protein HO133_003237 [Letharia lupina]
MASSGGNVLRYAALLTGVGYGFYHQASIAAQTKMAHIDREFENQASLISKAKAEWAKKTMPKEVKEGAVISDPNDPKFDLEAYLTMSEAK